MNFYETMTSRYGWNFERYTGDVGIEIETESLDSYRVPKTKFWNVVEDGSLRNFGREYILKQPLKRGEELETALSEFKSLQDDLGLRFIQDSISTSVHVHLNVLNLSWLNIANLLTTYSLVEPLLIRHSGPDRKSNLFCLPLSDAEESVNHLMTILSSVKRLKHNGIDISSNECKYSALNVSNLSKLGTLEVRSFRGETNTEVISEWVSILLSLRDYASQGGLTPLKIIESYRDQGVELLTDIFGKYREDLRCQNETELLDRNLIYAARLATTTKDWTNFGIPKIKKLTTEVHKAKLDEMAFGLFGVSFKDCDYARGLVVAEEFERINGKVIVIDSEKDV